MSDSPFSKQLAPFSKRLVIPSAGELADRAKTHERLNVTADYLEVLQSGFLGLDLAADVPIDWKKVKSASRLAQDITMLSAAASVTDEDLPEALDASFYLVGSTAGGDLVVQMSEAPHRGKLARIPDGALGELESLQAPLTVDALVKASLLEIADFTLGEYVALRLAKATKPKKKAAAVDGALKALKKAFKAMEYGCLELKGLGAFELTSELGDLSAVKTLSLEECALTELPRSLETLPSFERLLLTRCDSLTELPDWLGSKLTDLSVEGGALQRLPALPNLECLTLNGVSLIELSLGSSTKLETLTLEDLPLTQLPDDLGALSTLKELEIKNCPQLTALPDSFCRLTSLEKVEIYDTGLAVLPERIGDLKALRRLVLGTWGKNQLTQLPDSLFELEGLRLLWLGNNRLETLPAAIGALKNLNALALDDNLLTTLPESVFELDAFMLTDAFSYRNNPIPAASMTEYAARIKEIYARYKSEKKAQRG